MKTLIIFTYLAILAVGVSKVESAPKKSVEEQCEPGSTWEKDCNTCICGPNFEVICTGLECDQKMVEEQCVPGSTWKEDCNTCFCGPDFEVICTLIPC